MRSWRAAVLLVALGAWAPDVAASELPGVHAGEAAVEPEPELEEVYPEDGGREVVLRVPAEVSLAEVRRRVRAYVHPLGQEGESYWTEHGDPPSAAELAAAGRGRPVPVVISREEEGRAFRIRSAGGWPEDARIVVVAQAGLRAQVGAVRARHGAIAEFETRAVQRILSESCRVHSDCPVAPLVIRRKASWDPEKEAITVTPRPEGLEIFYSDAGEDVIEGAFVAGKTYTVTIPGYGGPVVRRYTFTKRPAIELSTRSGILIAGRPRTIGVTSRHLLKIAVRAAVLSDAQAGALLPAAERGEAIAWPAGLTAVEREFSVTPQGVNEWADTVVDLQALLGEARGAVIVEARGLKAVRGELPPPSRGVVQVTNLTAVAVVAPQRSMLQVVRVGDGMAVAGATVGRFGTSDERGVVTLAGSMIPREERVAIADGAGDRVYVTLPGVPVKADGEREHVKWAKPDHEWVHATLMTTRGVVRPGESVDVIGWTWVDSPHVASGLRRLPAGTPVEVCLSNDGRRVACGAGRTDIDGVFSATVVVPRRVAVNVEYMVSAGVVGGSGLGWTYLPVAEDAAPGMRVRAEPLARVMTGSRAGLRVVVSDESGARVSPGRIDVKHRCERISWRPPGVDRMWWIGAPGKGPPWSEHHGIPRWTADRDSAAVFEVSVRDPEWPRRCQASVIVDGRVADETTWRMDPAAYLGIVVPTAARAGEPATVTIRAFTPEGVRTGLRGVDVWLGHIGFDRWLEINDEMMRDAPVCTLDVPARGADATCALGVVAPGYHVVAVTGGHGGPTWARFEVAAPVAKAPVAKAPATGLEVSSDRWARPGDVRTVRVRAPWATGSGLLWVERGGVLTTAPFDLQGGEATRTWTVAETWVPQVGIAVAAIQPLSAGTPAVVHDRVEMELFKHSRRLAVEVVGAEEVAAGSRIRVRVRVRDEHGRPVAGRIDAWMIDEAELFVGKHEFEVKPPMPRWREALAPVDTLAALREPFVARSLDRAAYAGKRAAPLIGKGGGPGHSSWHADGKARRPFVVGPPPQLGVRVDASGEQVLALEMPREAAAFRLFVVATADLADGGPGRVGTAEVTVHSVERAFAGGATTRE